MNLKKEPTIFHLLRMGILLNGPGYCIMLRVVKVKIGFGWIRWESPWKNSEDIIIPVG